MPPKGVNLLPWRAMRRIQTLRLRVMVSMLMLMIGLCAGGLIAYKVQTLTTEQKLRNQRLEAAIFSLDQRIVAIDDLQGTRERLTERIDTLQTLADDREQALKRFAEIAAIVPTSITLTHWSLERNFLTLSGTANGIKPVAALLSALEKINDFPEAKLVSITTPAETTHNLKLFHIEAEVRP